MKKNVLIWVVLAALCTSMTLSSCIGSFHLSNRVLSWNKEVSRHKFVNELVFFCFWVVPVYEVTTIADLLVVNSIEFWDGGNPLAQVEQEKTIKGKKAEYLVRYKTDGYRILNRRTNTSVDLVYDKEHKTWSAMSKGKAVEFMTFVDDNKVKIHLPKGKTMEVELSESGMEQFRQAIRQDYPEVALQ